jgi:hypothetical protein
VDGARNESPFRSAFPREQNRAVARLDATDLLHYALHRCTFRDEAVYWNRCRRLQLVQVVGSGSLLGAFNCESEDRKPWTNPIK